MGSFFVFIKLPQQLISYQHPNGKSVVQGPKINLIKLTRHFVKEHKKSIIPASTVLLIRDGKVGIEVFMVVRHQETDSFSGALVFPGGKVDPADAQARPFCSGSENLDDAAVSHQVAAVREVFEESGVLLACNRGSHDLIDAAQLKCIDARWRKDLAANNTTMAQVCRTEGIVLALEKMVEFAHWITPRIIPKIFDTKFFIAHAPADHVSFHDGLETTDSEWLRPETAIADAASGKRTLVFPTRMNLLKLSQYTNVHEAMKISKNANVVTVQPEPEKHPNGRILRIPEEAGYQGSQFLVEDDGHKVTVLE